MSIKRLNETDRKYIEKVYKEKTPYEIAEVLQMNSGTIRRELKRCPQNQYTAKAAQIDADRKHKNVGRPRKSPLQSYWQIKEVKKQIEVCIRMKPGIMPGEIAEILHLELETVAYYFPQVQKEMMEGKI